MLEEGLTGGGAFEWSAQDLGKSPGNTWHDIKVEASSSTIKVYYDNAANPDVQGSDFTCLRRGRIGLGVTSTSGGPHAHFDNVVVDALDNFQYDLNGNLVVKDAGSSWTYRYDYEDRLIEVRKDGVFQASYLYDNLGRRVKATESGTVTYTIYREISPLYTISGTTETDYVYAAGFLIAKVSGTTVDYFHSDALGSTRLVTDASANTVFETHYRPFG